MQVNGQHGPQNVVKVHEHDQSMLLKKLLNVILVMGWIKIVEKKMLKKETSYVSLIC